tara:strand:+ start:853 stop:1278 length:426 start_codon:yes stop_codon:yes gene_type:complete
MNKFYPHFLNGLMILIISIQILIYHYNNRPSSKVFSQKSMSVENFSSIVLSNSGITKIGSEKLNKIDEKNIYLEGKSFLENSEYKIYGNNISINMKDSISSSDDKVKVINSNGVLEAQGFKNLDSEGKIIFKGKVTFRSHD